jgi:hypothetical protein
LTRDGPSPILADRLEERTVMTQSVDHQHTAMRGGSSAGTASAAIARLAGAWLDGLAEDQRRAARWPFDDAERFNWHYVPRPRRGLPIKAMDRAARAALDRLLRHALSASGYAKATGIMRLEEALGALEGRPEYRDPENYSVSLFGEPGRGPWGWRIEGHHLSLNLTATADGALAVVPAFWGANPARVPDGYPMSGHRVLGRETDLAYELVRGLDETTREQAIIAQSSLGNIVTGPERADLRLERQGVELEAMPDGQRNLALELLATYARNLCADLAEAELHRIREADVGKIRFAWGGPLESGHAHYFRLQGPITLIEYDCTQNDANHIHSVWHDLERDFGRDLLAEHYRHGHDHG